MNISKRARVVGQDIHIKKYNFLNRRVVDLRGVMLLNSDVPLIRVFENNELTRSFKVDPLTSNPNLEGKFLHYAIRVLENDAVVVDGIISDNQNNHLNWTDEAYEAVRFQPFFLKSSEQQNKGLVGKGLFERGLHYSGTVTPSGVRNICICDYCRESFTLQHIHAGFSEMQYFYSGDSKQTLLVRYSDIETLPHQLAESVDNIKLAELEKLLPDGDFKYYNSFLCPYCNEPFIDFEKDKEIRPTEYYANKLINTQFQYFDKI